MMRNPVQGDRPQGSEPDNGSGTIEIKKTYGPGGPLPPGAVEVKDRILARYVTPGMTGEPHGVPPIGIIGLPEGWILAEMFTDDSADLECLPFRFPWYSRAYALRCGDRLCAVIRNVQPMELSNGQQVVVQFNDSRDWTTVFGRIGRMSLLEFELTRPDGTVDKIENDIIHFVGKVMCWWDEEAKEAAE